MDTEGCEVSGEYLGGGGGGAAGGAVLLILELSLVKALILGGLDGV